MTTYARKIAEAVRDAAANTFRECASGLGAEAFIRALDLDAIIAGVPEPQAAEPVDDCSASLPFAILHDEMAALKRFDECVTDGEGYDVPKEMMKRLSEIGLVRRVTANVYEHTNFGLAVLAGDFAPQPSQPAASEAARDTKRLDFLCDHVINVRDPLRHGSRDMFWASPTDDDSGHAPSNLRALIDAEIERLDRAEEKA